MFHVKHWPRDLNARGPLTTVPTIWTGGVVIGCHRARPPAGKMFHVKHCARDPPAGDAKRQAAQVPARRAPNYNLKYLWNPNLTTFFLCTNGMVVGRMFHVKHFLARPLPSPSRGAIQGVENAIRLGGQRWQRATALGSSSSPWPTFVELVQNQLPVRRPCGGQRWQRDSVRTSFRGPAFAVRLSPERMAVANFSAAHHAAIIVLPHKDSLSSHCNMLRHNKLPDR